MKIAIITCYDQNNYIRARGLRTALLACEGAETVVVKNQHKGLARYLEVPLRVLQLRFREKPDAYVVTFRGYEMLLFMRLTGVRKPIIFDEMINLVEYLEEHGKTRAGTALDRGLRRFYHWLVAGAQLILADTRAHAVFSAKMSSLPLSRYRVIPVAAEESLFFPERLPAAKGAQKPFTVFYYGNGMTPLHGLEHVLEAATLLKDNPGIHFNIVGGKQLAAAACAAAADRGAHVTYETWVPFEELPGRVHSAGLCLGGPFGKTLQSQFVITGKTTQFLACAAPVLAGKNKVSGMFIDKQNCLLVPPAQPEAIAEAIAWAAAHPAELKRIGLAGRKLYETHFSQAVVNRLVADVVGELGTHHP
jgi:glycosyltransferase involved in cell wall biosynthesis